MRRAAAKREHWPDAAVAPAPNRRALATIGLMMAAAMQAADGVIVNVALPRLTHDLGGDIAQGAWVLTGYLCATAVMAPLTGWLRARLGAQRLFAAAIGVFVAASLLCAVAPSWTALIAFRILQGAGGGIIQPLSQAILLDIHPRERHGRMLALWGAALMLGPVLGPLAGGVITDLVSWRAIFAINLPLGILTLCCMFGLRGRDATLHRRSLDPVAVAALMVAIAALELFLTRSVGRDWLSGPELPAEAAIAIAAAALLLLRAARGSGVALIRAEVFRDLNFATAAFCNFMLSALLFVSIVFLPLLGQEALGFTASEAGATIVPRAVLMMVILLGIGRVIEAVSFRILLAAGWLIMATGLAILASLRPGPDAALWIVVGSMIQAGGAAMLYTPLSTLAFRTLPADLRTDASGLYSLLRQLGYGCGIALMMAVLHLRLRGHLVGAAAPGLAPSQAAGVDLAALRAYTDCFRMMALAALAITPAIFLFRLGPLADPPARTR